MNTQKETFLTKTIVVWFLAMICCALWGSAFPVIKIGYRLVSVENSDTAAQILFAGCRFAMAGLLTVLIGSLLNRKCLLPTRQTFPMVLKLSLFQTIIQYLFFYIGVAHTAGVKGSIINASNVFFAILVSSLIFKQEVLSARKLLGCAVGFAGVVLINLNGGSMDMSMSLYGEGFVMLSAVSYAISSSMIKNFSQKENPVTLSGWQFFVGGLVMILCGWCMGGRLVLDSPAAFGVLLYLAFLSAVAYSLWGILLKYNPVSKVAMFGFMNPMFGVLFSAWLLGESSEAFGIRGITALLLVCAGICIVNRPAPDAKAKRL